MGNHRITAMRFAAILLASYLCARTLATTCTPYQQSPNTGYRARALAITTQGTAASTFSDLGVLTEVECLKACDDNPNCAAAVLLADGACHINIAALYTQRPETGSTLYHKLFRVRTTQAVTIGYVDIRNKADGLCLENPGDVSTNYTTGQYGPRGNRHVTTYQCSSRDPKNARRWGLAALSAHGGLRRNIFAINSSYTNGTVVCLSGTDTHAVKLESCSVTEPYQRWTLLDSDRFRNEASGRCLEVDPISHEVALKLCDCDSSSTGYAAQQWVVLRNQDERIAGVATTIDMPNVGNQRFITNPHTVLTKDRLYQYTYP